LQRSEVPLSFGPGFSPDSLKLPAAWQRELVKARTQCRRDGSAPCPDDSALPAGATEYVALTPQLSPCEYLKLTSPFAYPGSSTASLTGVTGFAVTPGGAYVLRLRLKFTLNTAWYTPFAVLAVPATPDGSGGYQACGSGYVVPLVTRTLAPCDASGCVSVDTEAAFPVPGDAPALAFVLAVGYNSVKWWDPLSSAELTQPQPIVLC